MNGTGIVSGSTVNWNGTALATTFVSSAQLTAIVPAADTAGASSASITVSSPGPGGGVSNALFFSVSASTDLQFTSVPVSSGTACATYVCNNFIAADLNGDQKLDLAFSYLVPTHYYDDYTVLGNGDGTFRTPVSVGNDFIFFAIADFNGDGKPDMLGVVDSGNAEPYIAYIYLGNGDGTFSQGQRITSINSYSITASSPMVGDFNGDGKLDVALGADRGLEVYLGNGDGTFQNEIPPTLSYAYFFPNAVGDFNADGRLDLVGLAGTQLGVYQSNGDGTFQNPASVYTVDASTSEVFAVDLNGDNKLDLITVAPTAISVLLGNGDGTFQTGATYSIGGSIGAATIGDLNADGKIDVAASDSTSSVPSVAVMLGNGDGTFQNPAVLPTAANAGIVAGDFNNDGKLDLAGGTDNGLFLLLQDYQSDFSLAAATPSVTIAPGHTADYTITVTPGAGFAQTVQFTCSGAPTQSSCTVTPSSVTMDGSKNLTVSVAVTTTAGAMASFTAPAADSLFSRSKFSACLAFVGLLGLFVLPALSGRSKANCQKRLLGLAIVCLILVGGTMSGCSSGSNTKPGGGGTQAGTYNLTVTGTSTAASTTLTHTVNLTMIVQ